MYVRMGKADLGRVHSAPPRLEWGRLCPLKQGQGRLGWIATGSMAATALAAARSWPGSSVYSAPSLKPLHADAVVDACIPHEVIVVLEEHSVYSGLGAAVAEILSAHAPAWVCRIGIQDCFSQQCGSYDYLMKEHGLDAASVVAQVSRFLEQVPQTRDKRARRRVAA